jgi:DNA-directed RNA polymerase subunit RPC12/RpoP
MIIKKDRYDKNFYDGDEMCIGCGTEFDALEEIIILGDVIDGGDSFICMDCAKVLQKYLKTHVKE